MAEAQQWQKELETFKGIKSTFIIEGNICDIYPNVSPDGSMEFNGVINTIYNIFNSGNTQNKYEYLVCDSLFGFSNAFEPTAAFDCEDSTSGNGVKVIDVKSLSAENETFLQRVNSFNNLMTGNGNAKSMVKQSELIRTAIAPMSVKRGEANKVIIVNYASRFVSAPDRLSDDEITFFNNLLYASVNAREYPYVNTLILLVDKIGDIPSWFYVNNPKVRLISVANPSRIDRMNYVNTEESFESLGEGNRQHLVDLSDGMKLLEMSEIGKLYQREINNVSDITEIVNIYKYSYKEDKWSQIRDRVNKDTEAVLKERVKGQDRAIAQAAEILKRAVSGLSGMQHSSDSKPRGIMFFTGPTGTGKTELAKAITQLIFEDERALIRFDMSEYREQHSDQKLFGAPPGYVGYDQGGQLTNAVKRRPFSVLLFDEIEKAHPSIMDKFLQILEDGRMTDGHGQTVYFTETLIIFTSNVGISREIIDPVSNRVIKRENIIKPGESYEDICTKVNEAMNVAFKPEVLNRIGNNIIVFNYIDEESSNAIVDKQLNDIVAKLEAGNGVKLDISDDAKKWFYAASMEDDVRKNGGRGIGNVIEKYFLNPLGVYMCDNQCEENATIRVSSSGNGIVFESAGR